MHMIRLKLGLDPKTVSIDKENRRLNGVIAIEPIDIKDWRPFSINDEFIYDFVSQANKSKDGLKSHWGHNWNNLGKQLGRAVNWRLEEGKAKYDLHIGKYADKAPGLNGLGEYVMDLLEEDSKAVMSSIVFQEDYFYQLDSAGQKVKVYYYDKNNNWVRPNEELGKVYPKLKKAHYVDVVEEGAATNSMFEISPDHDFDQTYGNAPGILDKFITALKSVFNPEAFGASDTNTEAPKEATPIIQFNNQDMDTNQNPNSNQAVDTDMESLQAENAQLRQQLADAQKSATDHQAALDAMMKRIEALEKAPAAEPTALDTGAGGDSAEDEPLWMQNPINKEAIARFENLKKLK